MGVVADETLTVTASRSGNQAGAEDSLTITDNRTGETYSVPIVDGAIRATELRGVLSYDPAFLNTASCRSAITYIDGDAGILRYRGYPIEEVAEKAKFLEIAYLLLEGELPTRTQLASWEQDVRVHTYVHENVKEFLRGLPLRRAPDGDAARRGQRALDLLPGREGDLGRREPLPAADAADREAAHDRGLHLPPLARPPLRAAAERSRLRRQLREHDLRDRRPPRAEPGAAARARDAADPARRPRAELLDERGPRRRLLARRSVLGRLGGDRGPLRAAPRRRQRGGAADARRDRRQEERAGVHRGREGRARAD